MKNRLRALAILLVIVNLLTLSFAPLASAATTSSVPNDFSLQVTPSPLVATLQPGTTSSLELKIYNGGSGTEDLKIRPRTFTFNTSYTQVSLNDTAPPAIANWISFSAPAFSVPSKSWFTETIKISLPQDSGFSYSFALVISRQKDQQPVPGSRVIKGSVAVFTLLNVDRTGATRKLNVAEFETSKRVYQYLPATFSVRLSNTGNTIAQPTGNIFIERSSGDKKPVATLPVNPSSGYILPGTTRQLTTGWNDGFPAYQTITATSGTTSQKLVWNWAKLNNLRIGRYTAKLVAVYNDGKRDVPLQAEVSFWVIPWKILLVFLLIAVLVVSGIWFYVRPLWRRLKSKRQPTKGRTESGPKHSD